MPFSFKLPGLSNPTRGAGADGCGGPGGRDTTHQNWVRRESRAGAAGDRDAIPISDKGELNFGLRWDFVGNEPIDLDVSCVSFDDKGNPGEVVFYNQLTARGEWMVHTGDNTTGEGDDDDEAIQVFIPKIPKDVYGIALVVTCHNVGHSLGGVDSVQCVVTDMAQKEAGEVEPLAVFDVKLSKDHSAAIVCCLRRTAMRRGKERGKKGEKRRRRREQDETTNAPVATSSTAPDQEGDGDRGSGGTGSPTSGSPNANGRSVASSGTAAERGIRSLESSTDSLPPVGDEGEAERRPRSASEGSTPRRRADSAAGWELVEVNVPAHGHTVGERRLLLAMRASLGLSEEILATEMNIATTIDTTKRAAVQIRGDVNHVVFAVGWSRVEDDLDCTLIFFNESREYLDHVNSKNKLISNDKAVVHRGDSVFSSTTKSTAQDKESVDLHIPDIAKEVDLIFFAVSTVERDGRWTSKVSQVQGAYCRLYEIKKNVVGKGKTHNVEDRKELARSNLQRKAKDAVGQVFACMYRDPAEPSGWYVQQISEPLATLPVACVSPSEFMPITRSLAYFVRSGFKTHADEWIPNGWITFRDEMRVRYSLTLKVVEGRNLGPQGPFFKCHVEMWTMHLGKNTVRHRTGPATDRTNPTWNEAFAMDVTFLDSIKVVVFDRYFIGHFHIPLVKYRSSLDQLADKWFDLEGLDVEGAVRLQISMVPCAVQKVKVLDEDEVCTIL